MSVTCGHCQHFASSERCAICGRNLCHQCTVPCPEWTAALGRIAELEEKMRYLDNIYNIPGLKERKARSA